MYVHTYTRGIVARTGYNPVESKYAAVCTDLYACTCARGATRANPIRWVSGTNGGSMFYRYCSRRATDTSRVGRRAYIARAFSRLLQDLWISVCLSPNLSCPPSPPPSPAPPGGGDRFSAEERRVRWTKLISLDFFFGGGGFALRCGSLIGEVNRYGLLLPVTMDGRG